MTKHDERLAKIEADISDLRQLVSIHKRTLETPGRHMDIAQTNIERMMRMLLAMTVPAESPGGAAERN